MANMSLRRLTKMAGYKEACTVALLVIVTLAGLLVSPGPAPALAQNNKRVTKENLIAALESCKARQNCTNCKLCQLTASDFIKPIRERKVDFQLKESAIREIQQAGSFLNGEGLNDLIIAVRDNFQPRADVPYSGVQLTETLAQHIRELNSRASQSQDSKLPEAVGKLINLLTQLAGRKSSIATGLLLTLREPKLNYETNSIMSGDFYQANETLKAILTIMEQVDPGWTRKNVDKSILTYRVIYDKQRLMFAKETELKKGSLSEAQIRTMAEDFENEAEILGRLAKDLGTPNP